MVTPDLDLLPIGRLATSRAKVKQETWHLVLPRWPQNVTSDNRIPMIIVPRGLIGCRRPIATGFACFKPVARLLNVVSDLAP
jgi:hypothetical protein